MQHADSNNPQIQGALTVSTTDRPTDASRVTGRLASKLRVLIYPACCLVMDLVLRMGTRGSANPTRWSVQDAMVYGLGALWGAATWLLVIDSVDRWTARLPVLRRALLGLIAVVCAALFMSSFAYRKHFDQSPSWQVLKWSIAEFRSVVQIARWVVGWQHGLTGLGMVALFIAVTWRPARAFRLPRGGVRLGAAVLAGGAYLAASVLTLCVAGFQDPLPVDANAAAAFAQFAIATTTRDMHLVTPVRPEIPPQPAAPRPNVLLLVQESLRADAVFADLGYLGSLDSRGIAPFGSTLPSRRAEGFFVFPRARTNSTATESSVPSILSGVDPGGATDSYGRATSVWALGKATGAATFLFSAQSYSFSHFDEYFIDKAVDVDKTGQELSPVLVNDRGIDDGIAVDAALAHIESLARARKPFVGVVHFNGTHSPGWPGPDVPLVHRERDNVEQYSLAARYIDKQVERIVRRLDDLGLADRTIVINTSDHGENIGPHHPVDRLGSFFEETTRIPVWIRVPPMVLAEHPDWAAALDAWKDRNVQNLDRLPTVRDVLGMRDVASLGRTTLPGRSLVQPPPAGDDIVMGQSTCAFRAWALDGFYMVHGRIKFIASNDQPTPQVYDLDTDPHEARNLWPDPAWQAKVLPWVSRGVLDGEERRAVCRRVATVCPVKVPSAP
jgi:glucan phosphoethanolaminetransferase (alkaline phosphatase superfamily)